VKADIVDYGDISLGSQSTSVDNQLEKTTNAETGDEFVKTKHVELIGAANKAVSR